MAPITAWAWGGLALFLVGCGVKAARYARMPMHLRWELHPLASGDDPDAAAAGGAEGMTGWRRLAHEARFVAREVASLAMVRRHNPSLWPASLAFHWGIYLLFLLGAGTVAAAAGLVPTALAGRAALVIPWQLAGVALATSGAVALLVRRAADPVMRRVSRPADFLQLGLLLAALLASWGRFLWADPTLGTAVALLRGTGLPDRLAGAAGWAVAEVALVALFLGVLPFTRMTHFFTKFFAWHLVRWDERANPGGARFAGDLARQLERPMRWRAPHAGGGGSWRDAATRRDSR